MSVFQPDNLASACSGRWLQRPIMRMLPSGVGIDTRGDLSGRVFFAIGGERHDGHDFLADAVAAGAVVLVVEREPAVLLPEHVGVLLVDDTRAAMARAAGAHRNDLTGTKVIAITGSSGKTTTKSLIEAILSSTLTGSCAPKSFNNHIGVPLTILNADPADDYLLLEIGTNAPGEVDQLAAIARPDVAVITMIGRSHLEGLGSLHAVAKEKTALLRHLRPGGLAVLHADSPHLREYVSDNTVLFGTADDAHLRLTDRGRNDDGWWFEINNSERFSLGLPGRHNALNALAAVAVGRHMGIDDAAIRAALRRVQPCEMRMVRQRWGEVDVYNDAYNANPDSMIAAMDTFAELTADAKRRVMILGDMLELGEESIELHREVGRHLNQLATRCPVDLVILVGGHARHIGEGLHADRGRIMHIPELSEESISTIHDALRDGDAVLLKGSRGLALERVFSQSPGMAMPEL